MTEIEILRASLGLLSCRLAKVEAELSRPVGLVGAAVVREMAERVAVVNEVCQSLGVPVETVIGPVSGAHDVRAGRARVVQELKRRGWTWGMLARVLGMNERSVKRLRGRDGNKKVKHGGEQP